MKHIRRLVEIGLGGEDAIATKRTTKSYDDTTAAAREIIDAQDQAQEAKTARLRKARLDKEAADLLAHAPGKPN